MNKLLFVLCLFFVSIGAMFGFTKVGATPSTNLVISQFATSVNGSASSEFVELKNISESTVDITDWCVKYSSASGGTSRVVGCFNSTNPALSLTLPSGGYISFMTADIIGTSGNILMNSGMSDTGGHLLLYNKDGEEVDRVGWGGAVNPEGVAIEALPKGLSADRLNRTDTDNNMADFSISDITLKPSDLYEEEIVVDVCLNIEGTQPAIPEGLV